MIPDSSTSIYYTFACFYVSVKLNLVDLEEEYEFSLPSAYARSILTVPWVELGDKVTINCPKSGYSASVIFHTKVSVICSEPAVYLLLGGCLCLNMCVCVCVCV